jgi:hypothetical protein
MASGDGYPRRQCHAMPTLSRAEREYSANFADAEDAEYVPRLPRRPFEAVLNARIASAPEAPGLRGRGGIRTVCWILAGRNSLLVNNRERSRFPVQEYQWLTWWRTPACEPMAFGFRPETHIVHIK